MKKFFPALLLISTISSSFVIGSTRLPAVPIHYDDDRTGTYVYFNQCTNETVDVTFTSRYSFRGSMNDQKFILKIQLNELQEGIGRISGIRYTGHVNESDNQSGSFINGSYLYSKNLSVRMVSQGDASNFKSNVAIRYSLNPNGVWSSSREEQTFECQ